MNGSRRFLHALGARRASRVGVLLGAALPMLLVISAVSGTTLMPCGISHRTTSVSFNTGSMMSNLLRCVVREWPICRTGLMTLSF